MNLDKMSKKYKQKFLPRELAALIEIRHENIIRVYDIFRSNRKIYVFMEFASNGDIAKHLKKNGPMTEEKAREWFMQISNALNYLHEEMYTAHRDIKIDNILLNDNYVAKLTDFGFATEAIDSDGAIVMSETFCGTMPYYCPQILSKKAYNPFKADVWAHGIVLYAMTHNRFPFHFKDRKVMIKEQQNKKYIQSRFVNVMLTIYSINLFPFVRIKKTASDEMRDLLMKMLEVEENDRLSFKEVLAHKWANKAEESEN